MKEQRFLVTMKDIQRYRILKDCLEKRLKVTEASHILGLSYIHLEIPQNCTRFFPRC